jgi:hypothetical protein
MRSPYTQVALTYLRRPFVCALTYLEVCGALCAVVLPFVSLTCDPHEASWNPETEFASFPILFFGGMTVLFGMAAVHVKQQFADPRARLMPGFRRAHIAGAIAVFLILAVVLPISAASLAGLSCLGLTAVEVLWYGLVFSCIVTQSALSTSFLIIAVFAVFFGHAAQVVTPLIFRPYPPYSILSCAALVGGLVLVGSAGFRLLRLNEDMPEYHRRWRAEVLEGSGERLREPSRIPLLERQVAQLTRHARRASVSRWSRMRRWQGPLSGRSAITFALVFAALTYLFVFATTKTTPSMPVIALTSTLPALIVEGTLLCRRQYASRESLLCVDRAAYLRQVGAVAGLDQLTIWLCLAACASVWLWCVTGELSLVASVLAFSALSQPWLFGVCLWSLQCRSPASLAVLGILLAAQLGTLGAVIPAHRPPLVGWPTLIGIAAAFALLGIVLTCHAYHRWLVADID